MIFKDLDIEPTTLKELDLIIMSHKQSLEINEFKAKNGVVFALSQPKEGICFVSIYFYIA